MRYTLVKGGLMYICDALFQAIHPLIIDSWKQHTDSYDKIIFSNVENLSFKRRPRYHRVPSSDINFGIFIGPHIRREYWYSSLEAESREIRVSCKNLFLNRYEINMFKPENDDV